MPTFERCEKDNPVVELLEAVIDEHHERLADAEVAIGVLMAYGDRDERNQLKGPALKLHGWPCLTTVRIVGYRQRVAGLPDAEIAIDGDQWPELTPEKRAAILDHELTHLAPVTKGAAAVVMTDAAGRPKLKMRPHDYQVGGFAEVAERQGRHAAEVWQMQELAAGPHGQLLFPFAQAAAAAQRLADLGDVTMRITRTTSPEPPARPAAAAQ